LLKAFFGNNATAANDFGYGWLPQLDDGANYSWLMIFDAMDKGTIKGFFAWGQNPTCSGANAGKVRRALGKLDWMVNVNLFDNETCSFWKGPGMNPSEIKTEVFFLPCAGFFEKEGSITNSGRWMQWRYKAVEPAGESKPDGEIMSELVHRIKKLVMVKSKFSDPILNMTWDYGPKKPDGSLLHFNTHAVAKEINGYFLEDKEIKGTVYKKGTLVPSFAFLQDDGSTSSGNWLYCHSYTEKGNMAARRNNKDESGIGLYSEWAWCWPVNRRIIYNRASVDEYGKPWDNAHPVIYWNGSKWVGDVPDGGWPPLMNEAATRYAFIMKPEGHAHIFGPGLAEGPFPEHYEPLECPVEKNLIPGNPIRVSPTVKLFGKEGEGEGQDVYMSCDPRYPLICSTYRVTEHWQTGLMTRWQPWLAELQPAMFVEMSKELAEDRDIKNGDLCLVKSARGEVEAIAIVTDRFKPFVIAGQTVHQVGIPWHYGWVTTDYKNGPGLTFGDSANLLTPTIGDSNTMIPESKAFMVNVVRKGV
jgi:formate dehydrogenase major subunit